AVFINGILVTAPPNSFQPPFTVNSATQLTISSVPSDVISGKISVQSPGGLATSANVLTVTTPALPTVTGFAPTSGGSFSTVVITGTNFTGATAVLFNGTPANSFTVNSPTQVTATVPFNVTAGPISVVTPGGVGTSTGNFSSPV